MEYEVKSNSNNNIDWNATGIDRVLQNVNNILNIVKNEVPYKRDMGRDTSSIDRAAVNIKEILIEETFDLINEYEPRAIVQEVLIDDNNEIKVVIEVD